MGITKFSRTVCVKLLTDVLRSSKYVGSHVLLAVFLTGHWCTTRDSFDSFDSLDGPTNLYLNLHIKK